MLLLNLFAIIVILIFQKREENLREGNRDTCQENLAYKEAIYNHYLSTYLQVFSNLFFDVFLLILLHRFTATRQNQEESSTKI